MALNAVELLALTHLVKGGRALLLGYPDILCDKDTFERIVGLSWDALPKRDGNWREHGREIDGPMIETKGFFLALGTEAVVIDAIDWGGQNYIVDLNEPLSSRQRSALGVFDLVVDPGTVEHCFNVAQAFQSIVTLLKTGGVVYHQAAVSFPNHGFWSISPTAFFDFYEVRGFELGQAYISRGTWDSNGFVPKYQPISPFGLDVRHVPAVGIFAFRKRAEAPNYRQFPIQRCYSSLSRDIHLTDFLKSAIDRPSETFT